MSRRGGFATELGISVVIATMVGVAFLLATGELGAAWDALRGEGSASGEEAAEGADEESPSPTGTASTPTTARPGIEYIDVNHISEELNERGVTCADTNVHIQDEESETGTCTTASGAEVTIFVYLRAPAAPESFEAFIDAEEGSVLEGPNWFLASTDEHFLGEAQGIVGGEIRDL